MASSSTRADRRRATHARSSQKTVRRILGAIVVGVLVIAVSAIGLHFLRSGDSNSPASLSEPCSGSSKVNLVVAPEIADTISTVVKNNSGVLCGAFTVTAKDSPKVLEEAAAGKLQADAWISDSSMWVSQAQIKAKNVQFNAAGPFAVTPVVVAAPDKARTQVLPDQSISWKRVVAGSAPATVPDPALSTVGMVGFVAARQGMGGDETQIRVNLGAGIIRMASGMVHAPSALPAGGAAAPPAAYLVSEREVAVYNKAHADNPLSIAVPAEGTIPLEYQVVTMSGDEGIKNSLSRLDQKMRTADVAKVLRDQGFRLSTSDTGPPLNRGASYALSMVEAPDGPTVTRVLRQWKSMTSRLRMMVVVDTSGSMADKQPGTNLSLIDLTVAALKEGVKMVQPVDEVGLMEFSNNNPRGGDSRLLVPVKALGDESPTSHRTTVSAALSTLPSLLKGDTPLYNTIADAAGKLQEGYKPDMVQIALILTDGKNDTPSGLTLDQLTQKLKAGAAAGKPVYVVTLGVGTGTDPKALKQIADATGGESAVATDPQDISKILISALMKI